MNLEAQERERTYLNYRGARHQLEMISSAAETACGLGRLATKVQFMRAERRLEQASQQMDAIWGEASPKPGSIVESQIIGHTANLGIVQTDGSISHFSVPTKPLVGPRAEL